MPYETHNNHIRATRRHAFRAAFPGAFGPLESEWTKYEAVSVFTRITAALRADRLAEMEG